MVKRYLVYLHNDAKKILQKIPRHIAVRIDDVISELELNPLLGIKMHGEISHLRKIKISNYRMIYQVYDSKLVIVILEIESRGNVFYDRS
ncbi:MAG: type II toxin-antitoxin system mRNA interferase toxin, RelE/StbE family [bacterium]